MGDHSVFTHPPSHATHQSNAYLNIILEFAFHARYQSKLAQSAGNFRL